MPDVTTPPAAPRAIGGAHLVTRDTNFRINSFNSASGVVLTIVARLIGFDGSPIVDIFTHTPNTDRSIKSESFYLSEGWLVSLQTYASSGTPRRGQCFVRAELIQGFTGATLSIATLLQGYVQDTTALAYPGSELVASIRGRGVIRSIAGTDPAAGAEISETVPTNARWRLIALTVQLVTDVTVANRSPYLLFDDGANVYGRVVPVSVQAASLTYGYDYSIAGANTAQVNGRQQIALPTEALLMGGHRIRTLTNNLAAGDNWGAPQYLVEEWIED